MQALVNALKKAWPMAATLQCQWHILQANWRWLCSSDHGVRKDDRQQLLKLFKNMMYAKTRDDFEASDILMNSDSLMLSYPTFLAHLAKLYSHRVETWALYSRVERKLPTRGSNTNSYCEASMKTTKENQFGRVRTFNLPEMLQVICDDSAIYVTKMIDIGNGRDTALKQAKSKYLGKESNITEDQIVDLGSDAYLVESEKTVNKVYTCNMKSGFCTCPVGSTCAPCKHKAAVTKHTGKAQFSGTPKNDPSQRAMYHYIAWGRTLEPHMYRNINDPVTEPQIKDFVTQALEQRNMHESILEEDPAILEAEPAIENTDTDTDEEEYNSELVRNRFSKAMDDYKEKILGLHESHPQDPSTNNAMMAFTKTINKSLKCTPTTLFKQLHEFGKGTVATSRTKHGGIITVNPPVISRRTFKVPGRGPAPLGRPLKEQGGRVQLIVSDDSDYIAKSDKNVKQTTKKKHNFTKSVENNETLPKRHTKQGN